MADAAWPYETPEHSEGGPAKPSVGQVTTETRAAGPQPGDLVTFDASWDGRNRITARVVEVFLRPSVVLSPPGRFLNGQWTATWTPAPAECEPASEVERVESTLHGRLAMARARYEAAVIACDEAEREGRSIHTPIPRRVPRRISDLAEVSAEVTG